MSDTNLTRIMVVVLTIALSMNVSAQMHVDSLGNVGVGTATPTQSFHVQQSDGSAQVLVEETNGIQGPRSLFVIKNNGNPEFEMVNTGNSNSWRFSAGENFVVKSDSGLRVSVLTPTGDLRIKGQITTVGGTCGGGCDIVFDPETKIETIDEHAKLMWANRYLPNVGPTLENAPINLTDKTGRILNELEKAHIYIEQLHNRLAEVESSQSSGLEINAMATSVEQLQLENQVLRENQAQMLLLQHQQQDDFEGLKAMLVDLQIQAQSKSVLASLQ